MKSFLLLLLLNSIMFVRPFTQIARSGITRLSVTSAASSSIQRTATLGYVQSQSSASITTRFMSSTPSEEQTSVVDTCRAKIAKALETEDVKVLGTLYINCMYLSNVSVCVL